jgi:hypothetical protein
MRDPENCGSCATRCETGDFCYDGACTAACPGGFSDCGATCRDLDTDRLNCGACDTPCEGGQVCVAGTCEYTCAPGMDVCAGECTDLSYDPENCGSCGTVCGFSEACVDGSCAAFVGNVGTAREVDGTWIPVLYELCGTGSPGSCTAAAAKAACTAIGAKVVAHASDSTTDVHSLGATASCYYAISYYTTSGGLPSGSCLVGIANLDWSGCCGMTRWHGNTVAFGAPGAVFGYATSSTTGYVSTYPNVSGRTWGCTSLTTAASNLTGCTTQYVACTP